MPFKSFLTEEQARAIHADRRPYRLIAKEYDISPASVHQIKAGKTWKSLKLSPTKRYRSLEQHERRTISDTKASVRHGDTDRGQATD